ncbi:type II toxin-antitoxin system PrlF family antitoxin [Ruficoccus amylovorans]|uniref:Type II toxin-antitoxin system PrlF family antitoxin n=1 Tax=Ruficoccus amylovorans TaxID=1804625 RepID=A0A842HCD2_9BACT|nr:type II toxin-antitoxin system PrlF family antitoxin [Ruficoccus amylovorans]MBC2593849.1 type II toxin-antitoxin system PrlF family antitoxin [Ruficoccus amylovorans]
MELMSTVTSKGQTTVPLEVRRRLGLGPRQKIVYVVEDDGVRIKAAGKGLMSVAGALSGGKAFVGKEAERASYRAARAKRIK